METKAPRLVSLDALRGFDMFWIMSGEQIVHALAKATGWRVFTTMSDQLHHTVWDGFTFYDMIFPLFLFIAGVSMPFSMKRQAGVMEKRKIYGKMIRRTLILIALGMVVNGALRFDGLAHTRFASVLGRIGLAWFFAGLIYLHAGPRWQIGWLAILLMGYWAAMMWVPVPGYGAGVLTMQGSLESYIDRLLLPGRLHDGVHDPEGILSTIPAVGTALLGVFAGRWLQWQNDAWPMVKKGLMLAAAGCVLLLAGKCWAIVFPINKRLWSSSFVLYAGGWSVILLAIFYLLIDARGWRRWAFPLVVIGTNSILIYLAAEALVDFGFTAKAVFGGAIHLCPMRWQELLVAVSVTFVQWLLLYFLYRRKIFLKV